jgi:hypothetical protein
LTRRTAYLDYSEMTATGREMPGQIARMKRYPEERCGRPWFNEWAMENTIAYFKRECFPDDVGNAGVHPIAFGMLVAPPGGCNTGGVFGDLTGDAIVNGADLGILLSQWGPNSQFTVSDINKDGSVNGADLGLLLSFWGPCLN